MRRRRLQALLLATVVTAATVGFTPHAQASTTGATDPARQARRPVTITLITGDRVTTGATGSVSVQPGPGRTGVRFLSRTVAGHRYVIPADALPLLRGERVDKRLFDVTTLTGFGYDDTAAELPLLVAYPRSAKSAGARTATAVDGARVTRDLTAAGALAVRAGRDARSALWKSLTAGKAGLRAGVERVWLDGKRRISLDVSVPQIGAPAAWRAGLDGTGVTVAILDTGIDATHPDLAGQIAGSQNFTDTPDTDDTVGHGTHVASIIAGTGAASGGKYRGVAPGAKLLIGKVCGTEFCEDSDILAGMAWAAERAPVINMSLGGGDTPEIDPLEQAVNDLTARYGTLFVIAAGNSGEFAPVDSPGSADAALSVGAVDDDDQLADFSSHGPRTGDSAIKPDITAPGVDIVAARAANGEIGDPAADGYVSLSGTSMATPHVAGAAAILAQQHPAWTPAQRKTLLMGAARPTAGVDVFGQGAGRVDVARSIAQSVAVAEGSISFGVQQWPHGDDVPVTRTVTYRNDGDAPITLSLALSAPDAFTVAARALTVPAGGTATTTVTADTRGDGPDGRLSGYLVATGPGGVRVQTPVAVEREVESYDVTLRHTARDGAPTADYVTVLIDLTTGNGYDVSGEPTQTRRVPKGEYGLFSWIGTDTTTMLVDPRFTVGGRTTITLDARRGRPVSVTVPRRDAAPSLIALNADWTGEQYSYSASALVDEFARLFSAQIGDRTASGGYRSSLNASFARRTGDSFLNSPYTYDLLYARQGRFYTGFTKRVRAGELATMRTRFATEATGAQGIKSNFGAYDENDGGWSVLLPFDLPFQRTEYVNTDAGLRWSSEFAQELPAAGDEFPEAVSGSFTPLTRLRAGVTYRQDWNRAVFAPSVRGGGWAVREGDTLGVELPWFSEGSGNQGWSVTDTARVALYSGSTLIAENPDQYLYTEDLPATERAYRLEFAATRGAPHTLSTALSSIWTFRSGAAGQLTRLPLSTVRISPPVDLANSAPAGRRAVALTVEHQVRGLRTKVLNAEVSYDDGQTWRAAPVSGTGDHRSVTVNPAGPGFVSLRVHATDNAGNTVTQTVVRAWRIR